MSRIGRMPVVLPKGVDVQIKGSHVRVKGPKGELQHTFPADMAISLDDGEVNVKRPSDAKHHRALHGMTRALINNMVVGVSTGFEKVLEINGVGYRAELSGKTLVLNVGYSHPVEVEPPEGITFEVDTRARQIKIAGYDKQVVGHVAADIRKIRPPEPYKGKGIKYLDERIRRKAGKAGKV
ncbi:MAG: 50S ribosomal protein L6 [Anaerolineales bacterium]|nr:50S ribosomal protein L6 [Anaerolineales bacterium]MCK4978281.1 50S ribosomal protein L6 [Anaerolineales bacterium]MCK5314688.1 50S ribosomal protein L6 [Anaerolineales bacterium]